MHRRPEIEGVGSVDYMWTINVQDAVVVGDVEGIQCAADDTERFRVGVTCIEGGATGLSNDAEL